MINKLNLGKNYWAYEDLLTEFQLDDIKDMGRDAAEWYITDRIYEAEIIYYGSAMDFLKKYDDGLQESLGLAADFGYSAKDLSSPLLATLLYQEQLKDQLVVFLDDYFVEEEEEQES